MPRRAPNSDTVVMSVRLPAALRDRAKIAAKAAGLSFSQYFEQAMGGATPGGGDPLAAAEADAVAVALRYRAMIQNVEQDIADLIVRSSALEDLGHAIARGINSVVDVPSGGTVGTYRAARDKILMHTATDRPEVFEVVNASLPPVDLLPVGGWTVDAISRAMSPISDIEALRAERAQIVFAAQSILEAKKTAEMALSGVKG